MSDLAVRCRDLSAHYTDQGLLPRTVLLERLADPWHFSLHLLGGGTFFQLVLFAAAAVAACFLALGFHTKLATVCCWLLTVSVQNRNPLLLSGADVLLRMLLFWAMFLPLGAHFSLDVRRVGARPSLPRSILACGTAAYTLQVVAVYVFAGLIKLQVPAWVEGTGLAFALRSPTFAKEFASTAVTFRSAVALLSNLIPYFELWCPLLLLVPVRAAACRFACVLLFWGFHVGMAVVLDLGIFVPLCLVAWSAFLPAWTWDRLVPGVARAISWRTLPSEVGVWRLTARSSDSGRVPASPAPPKSPAISRWAGRGQALLCLSFTAYVLAWNVSGLRVPSLFEMPSTIRWIAPLLRLDQRWNMFSVPFTESGWLVIPAGLSSGDEVDLLTGARPVSWQRPAVVSQMFSTYRWRSYSVNITGTQYANLRLSYGHYLCRSWNRDNPGETLDAFKIYFMKERIEPWAAPTRLGKRAIWEHECREGLLRKWRHEL